MKNLIVGFLMLFCLDVFAYPENVTHGYANCMSCHAAPGGGGLLNDYGRSLSKELMSTWGGWENSEQPFFGAVKNTEWLRVGGHYRTIQTYVENQQIRQGKWFMMQQNLELGLTYNKISVIGTLGTYEGPNGTPNKGKFLSERHFLLWDLTNEVKLRLGKFRLNFGLNDPNHTRLTKQPLGFGSNSESYIMELSRFSEKDEIFLSADLGRMDLPRQRGTQKSMSVNYARYTSEKSKVGLSYLLGESETKRRNLAAVSGVVGDLEPALLKFEVAYEQSQSATATAVNKDLAAFAVILGYQKIQGLLPYLVSEHIQQDLKDSRTLQYAQGVGVQWLPIPHIEMQLEYKRQANLGAPVSRSDVGWLLFHLYL